MARTRDWDNRPSRLAISTARNTIARRDDSEAAAMPTMHDFPPSLSSISKPITQYEESLSLRKRRDRTMASAVVEVPRVNNLNIARNVGFLLLPSIALPL
jgi:hypothetical protein